MEEEEEGKLPKCDRDCLKAAETGTIEELRKILKDGTRLQVVQERNRNNPNNYAARFALAKEMPIKLLHCADVSGDTPLTLAAARGNSEAVRLFLQQGPDASADVDRGDKTGITALMRAAGGGFEETCTILLEYGANVDAVDVNAGSTALHRAALYGQIETAKVLVAAGATLSVREAPTPSTGALAAKRYGDTPLDVARSHQHYEVVSMLEAAQTLEGMASIVAEQEAKPLARAKAKAEAIALAEAEAVAASEAAMAAQAAEAKALADQEEAQRAAAAAAEAKAAAAGKAAAEAGTRADARKFGILEPLRFAGYGDATTVAYAVALCKAAGVEDQTDLALVRVWFLEKVQVALHPACRAYLAAALDPALAPPGFLESEPLVAIRLFLYSWRLPYGCVDPPESRVVLSTRMPPDGNEPRPLPPSLPPSSSSGR